MIKNKAYKFRLEPNNSQKEQIEKTFGCVRYVYNHLLEQRINAYKQDKISLKNNYSCLLDGAPFLREVDSQALSQSTQDLNTAYNNFFRSLKKNQNVGFPKFKSKKFNKNSYRSCIICDNIRIEDNKIKLPKLGWVKFRKSREVEGKIKSVTISKNYTGKYFISILVEYEIEIPEIKLDYDKSIGLDYSSSSLYVDSQNTEINYPRFFRTYENKLAREQRKLSRMSYNSNNYQKQRIRVAKIHEKIANSRNDFLHKLSTKLANEYDIVCVEDLNMKDISRCLKLGKSTMDNGFGMFRNFLQYKLELQGKTFVKINKWTPTSIVCSNCGCYHKDIVTDLGVRKWICPDCGTEHDRDVNAAINILNEGLRMLEVA